MAEWTKSCQTYVGSRSTPSWQDFQNGGDRTLSAPVQSCGGLRSAFLHGSHGTNAALSPSHSPVFIPAPTEKGFTGFMMDFHMGGVSAAVFLSQGHSLVFIPAPAEKGFTGFMMDFLMGGVSAAVFSSQGHSLVFIPAPT